MSDPAAERRPVHWQSHRRCSFIAGQRYGSPGSTCGIAPDACGATLGSGIAGDPRYHYGAAGGSPFECSSRGTISPGAIPDPYTGKFDTIGAFADPMGLQLHLQLTYAFTKRISLVVNLANLVKDCFGGTKTSFTIKGACSYGAVGAGTSGDVGNTYNPEARSQPYVNTPYEPQFSTSPFSVFVSARVKL